METKYTLQRPSRGTGNAGMPTPYNQGFAHASDHLNAGCVYDNPYNQPGEEEAQADFTKGFDAGVWLLSK